MAKAMKSKAKKRPAAPPRTKGERCTVKGCTRPQRSKGLCRPHYAQQLRGKPLSPLRGPHGRMEGLPEMDGSVAIYARVKGKRGKVLSRYAKAHGLSMYQFGSLVLDHWAEAHAAKKPVFRPHEKLQLWSGDASN